VFHALLGCPDENLRRLSASLRPIRRPVRYWLESIPSAGARCEKNNKIGEFAFLPLFIHFSSALLCGGFFKKKKKGARNFDHFSIQNRRCCHLLLSQHMLIGSINLKKRKGFRTRLECRLTIGRVETDSLECVCVFKG
jgi:hypothetical protein